MVRLNPTRMLGKNYIYFYGEETEMAMEVWEGTMHTIM
jgi:hypothetical protein